MSQTKIAKKSRELPILGFKVIQEFRIQNLGPKDVGAIR